MLRPRIGTLRKAKGLTQADLATMLGVSESAVGSWECGDRTPRKDAMWRLAGVLGVTVADLYAEDPGVPAVAVGE